MANNTLSIDQLGNRFVDDRDRVWGDSYNWSFNRKLDLVKYLVIHHSVTSPYILNADGTVQREKTWQEQVDEIGSLHKARGWDGIGYHFIITSQGIVAYIGDIGTGRANVLNHNEAVIGINLIGDFTKHLPTDIQINSAHDLCDFLLFHFPDAPNINGWEDVIGHKDCASIWNNTTVTACPGTSWPFDMKSRIKDNIVYTPIGQAPTTSPEPEATIETEPSVVPESPPDDDSGVTSNDLPGDSETSSTNEPDNGSDTTSDVVVFPPDVLVDIPPETPSKIPNLFQKIKDVLTDALDKFLSFFIKKGVN